MEWPSAWQDLLAMAGVASIWHGRQSPPRAWGLRTSCMRAQRSIHTDQGGETRTCACISGWRATMMDSRPRYEGAASTRYVSRQ